MARFETWLQADLKQLPVTVKLPGDAFSYDSGANRIGVEVYDGGQAVTLSGTVKANVIRPDGTTITVNGSKSTNKAYINLPSSAYTKTGRIEIYIKLYDGDDVTTLGACEGFIRQATTE